MSTTNFFNDMMRKLMKSKYWKLLVKVNMAMYTPVSSSPRCQLPSAEQNGSVIVDKVLAKVLPIGGDKAFLFDSISGETELSICEMYV